MPRRLRCYISTVSALGALAMTWAIWSLFQRPTDWPGLLVFVGVVILVELTGTDLMPGSRATVSVSSAVYYASVIVFGPFGGMLVAVGSGLAATLMTLFRREDTGSRGQTSVIARALFNMAAFGLSSLVAGVVYMAAGGTVAEMDSSAIILPILLGAVTLDLANAALIVGAVAFQTGQPPLKIWNENFVWAAPINILTMAVGGGGLALGYLRLDLVGLGTFMLPILATSYAFRLYVERTKAQMARLEEIIAERTSELQSANQELRRADQQKTHFYSIINHEMRTPLTSVLGYCDLLKAAAELDERSAGFVGTIKDNGQHLLDLVSNLLDVSRIEAGRMTLLRESVDISQAIQGALRIVQPLADTKNIAISADSIGSIPPVYADAKKTSQVIINLLSNAVKYSPDTGSITITTKRPDETTVQVDVADTGIGIPPEQLPTIFDRFSRVESEQTRDTVGTGLGLTITKGLVEAHGGRIWVESEEGVGSCFHFTIPIHAPEGVSGS